MNNKHIFLLITFVVLFSILLYAIKTDDTNNTLQENVTAQETTPDNQEIDSLSEIEIISATEEMLDILYELYFVTQDYSATDYTSTNELLMSLLTETMNDKNRLDKLILRNESLSEHPNELIKATGMVLNLGITHLSNSHAELINYIRAEDAENPSLSEFQYQLAKMQTDNKDAFFSIIEGTALFPYILIEFSESENENNKSKISDENRKMLISKIDDKFDNAFLEEDKWYEETANRNAVLLIVRNYREFLIQMETITN